MDLLIKTEKNLTWIGLAKPDGQLVAETTIATDRLLASTLVESSRCLLIDNKQSWATLTGVGVWAGPGPFTSLRVAHSFANGLAYGRQIGAANSSDPQNWQADCQRQLRTPQRQLIVPVYGAPAVRHTKKKD